MESKVLRNQLKLLLWVCKYKEYGAYGSVLLYFFLMLGIIPNRANICEFEYQALYVIISLELIILEDIDEKDYCCTIEFYSCCKFY